MTFSTQPDRNGDSSVDGIRNDLVRFVGGRIPDDGTLTAETDLLEAELLDSLLIMDVVAHVESTYGVKLKNGDIAPRHFRTVGSLAALVAERRS